MLDPQQPPENPYGQDWGAFTPNMPQAPTGYGAARGTNSAGFVAGTMDPTFGGGQYGQQQMMSAGYQRLMQHQARERS